MKAIRTETEVFQQYANLYDIFYQEKDYRKESQYVLDLIRKHLGKKPTSILDLGCGTGGHALIWASKGISVSGIDRSPQMLAFAKEKAISKKLLVRLIQGDVRRFNLKKKFDAVTSMFAVMSYLPAQKDLISSLRCIRKHLKPGGVFIFDAWFGPGVLTDPPGERVKSFYKDGLEILRTVKSVHRVNEQLVEVHYDILVIEKEKVLQRVKEVHHMHYFFPQEVINLAGATGFKVVEQHPFLRKQVSLGINDWNATFVLVAF